MPGFPAQLLAGLGAPGANGAPGGYPSVAPQQAPPAATPPAPPAGVAAPDISQVMLIKTLIDQGLQADQISAILQTMSSGQLPQAAPAYPAAPSQPQDGGWGAGAQGRDYSDRRGYGERSRSRSPDRWGRDSRGGYDRHGPGPRGSSRDRSSRSDYRNRSPMGRRDHGTPDHGHEKKQKWVEYDRNMRPGCIKGAYSRLPTSGFGTNILLTVMSRTLFVGGVT